MGLGFLWVGANAAYFFGDGDRGLGFFPELGVKIWRVEGVADFRVDGDEKWGAARVGLSPRPWPEKSLPALRRWLPWGSG